MPDGDEEIDVALAIIASSAGAFDGFDLPELRLPKTQDVGRQIEAIRDVADCPDGFLSGNRHHLASSRFRSAFTARGRRPRHSAMDNRPALLLSGGQIEIPR